MWFTLLHLFAATDCVKPRLFGLVPWYEYLDLKPVDVQDASGAVVSHMCRIQNFSGTSDQILGSHSPFLLIGLAILEDMIRIAALVAVGYIIYGGFLYITSQGAPDTTKKAQQTIINSLVGVAIAIIAASGVAFIGHKLGA